MQGRCPHCSQIVAVADDFLGDAHTCPRCGGAFETARQPPSPEQEKATRMPPALIGGLIAFWNIFLIVVAFLVLPLVPACIVSVILVAIEICAALLWFSNDLGYRYESDIQSATIPHSETLYYGVRATAASIQEPIRLDAEFVDPPTSWPPRNEPNVITAELVDSPQVSRPTSNARSQMSDKWSAFRANEQVPVEPCRYVPEPIPPRREPAPTYSPPYYPSLNDQGAHLPSGDASFFGPGTVLKLGRTPLGSPLVYAVAQGPTPGWGYLVKPSLVNGMLIESSLINGVLPVAPPGTPSEPLPYWPHYSEASPAQRARYLEWLAGGRVDPQIDLGVCLHLLLRP